MNTKLPLFLLTSTAICFSVNAQSLSGSFTESTTDGSITLNDTFSDWVVYGLLNQTGGSGDIGSSPSTSGWAAKAGSSLIPAITITGDANIENGSAYDSIGPDVAWTGGDIGLPGGAIGSGTTGLLLRNNNVPGDTFSFSIAAQAAQQVLTIYTTSYKTTNTLTASLSGISDYSSGTYGTSASGDYKQVFTIVFAGTGNLDIEIANIAGSGGTSSESFGIGAITLATIPEPTTSVMLAGMLALGAVFVRRRHQ